METNVQYRGWMAEQIAKSYLYETELLEVYQNEREQFDFVCMMKQDIRHVFAVEVKASQYSKSQIIRTYRKTREKFVDFKIPVLMLYINYIDRTGYFEFIQRELSKELSILTTQNLKTAIKSLNFA